MMIFHGDPVGYLLHQAAVESEEELEAGRDGRAGTLPMKLEGIVFCWV